MTTPRQQKILDLEKKLIELKAQQKAEQARRRAVQSKVERARDTRRKILAGAFLIEQLGAAGLMQLVLQGRSFSAWLTRPDDRALFDGQPVSRLLHQEGGEP